MPTLEQHAQAHHWNLETVTRSSDGAKVERWIHPTENECFADIERLLDSKIGWPIDGPCKDSREVYIRMRAARATIGSTFGHAGDQGYCAYYRLPDGRRLSVTNGEWHLARPEWSISFT